MSDSERSSTKPLNKTLYPNKKWAAKVNRMVQFVRLSTDWAHDFVCWYGLYFLTMSCHTTSFRLNEIYVDLRAAMSHLTILLNFWDTRW